MSHQITINDFKDSSSREIELAGSFGGNENKKLVASIDIVNKEIEYVIYNNRVLVDKYRTLEMAIYEYNKI